VPSRARPSTRSGPAPAATTRSCRRPSRGDALQLFADPAPAAAFPATPAAPEPESAFERRERLRAERHALVATLARRTGEPHRAVNARVNRDVGARSVDQATDEQLERAIRLLEREIARRR